VLVSRPDYPELPAGGESAEGVPAPGMRGAVGRARERAYKVLVESVPLEDGHAHGNGHAIEGGNGHGNGHAPAAVPSGGAQNEQHGSQGSTEEGESH
jgi:hypothetical protein